MQQTHACNTTARKRERENEGGGGRERMLRGGWWRNSCEQSVNLVGWPGVCRLGSCAAWLPGPDAIRHVQHFHRDSARGWYHIRRVAPRRGIPGASLRGVFRDSRPHTACTDLSTYLPDTAYDLVPVPGVCAISSSFSSSSFSLPSLLLLANFIKLKDP